MTVEQLDLVEINEAFAAQAIACMRELELEPDKTNVNGGAIALGHPLGASGARIATTLLHELRRRNGRYALATMCIGVGQGIATVFERVELKAVDMTTTTTVADDPTADRRSMARCIGRQRV